VTLEWLAGAGIIVAATFVFGLAGFGIGLVALSLLPYLMPPATAVPLVTFYAALIALGMTVRLRRDVVLARLGELLGGTAIGVPFGVWALAALPPDAVKRLIGLVLIGVVLTEVWGRYPELTGRAWGLAAGAGAGMLGGALGLPGPPVILYLAARRVGPRGFKATLQAFLLVNQTAVLVGFWWNGLLTGEVARLALSFLVPALAGGVCGAVLFERVDATRFRRIVFALLFGLGVALVLRPSS
jgi:uncharacterized membrane protein YfcA